MPETYKDESVKKAMSTFRTWNGHQNRRWPHAYAVMDSVIETVAGHDGELDKRGALLDFGCGRDLSPWALKLFGIRLSNVRGHDFNLQSDDWRAEEGEVFKFIVASNVLNVWDSPEGLLLTLRDIEAYADPQGAWIVLNYPKKPRHQPTITNERMLDIIKAHHPNWALVWSKTSRDGSISWVFKFVPKMDLCVSWTFNLSESR